MKFFSSDHHVSHNSIIRFCNRPFSSTDEMDEAIIKNHNRVVTPKDEVYFLGDFSFAKNTDYTIKFLQRLNGRKFLIHGNHDAQILKNKSYFIGQELFQSIDSYKEITEQGQHIVLFHYGMRVWNRSHHKSWLLYGHSHSTLPPLGKSVDVGLDSTWIKGYATYTPYSFLEIKAFMDKQSISAEDGHKEKDRS